MRKRAEGRNSAGRRIPRRKVLPIQEKWRASYPCGSFEGEEVLWKDGEAQETEEGSVPGREAFVFSAGFRRSGHCAHNMGCVWNRVGPLPSVSITVPVHNGACHRPLSRYSFLFEPVAARAVEEGINLSYGNRVTVGCCGIVKIF